MNTQALQTEYITRIIEGKTELQRQSLYEFIKYYWLREKKITLDENWHIKEICNALEKVYTGETKRLIINIPPRSLKTEIVSKAFPVWCLWHEPNLKFMGISYSSSLAEDNSWGARDMYTSDTYLEVFPRRKPIKDDQNTKQYWLTTELWQYYATGSQGTITGKGADIIIIDDPINPEEAESELLRKKVNNNYHNTIKSRHNDKKNGATVIIMQRLHDDDLTGHLLEAEANWTGEKWEKLIIPAISNWESFFEKRFPIEMLKQMQKENPKTFSTQMMQEPLDKDSQEFHEERFKYYNEEPKWWRIFTAVDPAFSKKETADNSSIITWMFKDMDLYILEITAWRFDPAELQSKILAHYMKYRPEKIGIEAVAAQTIIWFNLRAEMEKKNMSVTIEEIRQTWDKEQKIRKLIPLYNNGHIYHKRWMDELEHELLRFPKWKHDDRIDSLQMLYSMYELHPNIHTKNMNLEIKYDEFGTPIFIWESNTWQLQ